MNLREWAVAHKLPELVEKLNLTAGAICGTLPEDLRRSVYGISEDENLPDAIDWHQNGVIISPPGTGKGMAIFVESLAYYENVYVLVPSVIQAHKLEASLDALYDPGLAGCMTSQRKARGCIQVITTGIFHQLVRNSESDLWTGDSVLIVDEAQRILEQDPLTEFMVGYMAQNGLPTFIVSATIAPGTLPRVFGHGSEDQAVVYELDKQMHPVDIFTLDEDSPDVLLDYLECFQYSARETVLIFCHSRSEVMRVTNLINNNENLSYAVAVTGAHMVEDQISKIRDIQAEDGGVTVVATPGTMDSSVTIDGLSTVIIVDQRIRVDWNEHGVLEQYSETLPINHLWQMVRRVGRQQRSDDEYDQVYILTPDGREDVFEEVPTFHPITGCSPYTPIEDLLIEAVRLDVKFSDVHDYMVSTFSASHITKARKRLLSDGVITEVDDPTDPDGYELTDLGELVCALPFDYAWSLLVAQAPEEIMSWVAMVAAFGRLEGVRLSKSSVSEDKPCYVVCEHCDAYCITTSSEVVCDSCGSGFEVDLRYTSQAIQKIDTMVEYLLAGDDYEQRYHAQEEGFSFRRMEQIETLFSLALDAFGIELGSSLFRCPDVEQQEWIDSYLIQAGCEIGIFELFFLGKDDQGYSEARNTPGTDSARRFILPRNSDLNLDDADVGNTVMVVATPMWFTARSGALMSFMENIIVVPIDMAVNIAEAHAEKQGWMKLTFEEGEYRGKKQFKAKRGWYEYVSTKVDNDPIPGVEYWCSIDRSLTSYVKAVWVHYPVDPLSIIEGEDGVGISEDE